MNKNKYMENNVKSIGDELLIFIQRINSIAGSMWYIMAMLYNLKDATGMTLKKFVEKNVSTDLNEDDVHIEVPLHKYKTCKKIIKSFGNFEGALDIIPQSLFVTMVSQFDAFIGRLMRKIYEYKPSLLNDSEFSYKYIDLVKIGTIEEAREELIEKSIENILRKSHKDQISYLEKKLDVSLTKNLDSWPVFLELTERRNLFVHTEGKISKHYVNQGKELSYFHGDIPKCGDVLSITPEYFTKSYECLFEIAVKLTQVVWRLLEKKTKKEIDENLNKVSYELIEQESYDLVCRILDFIFENKAIKFSSNLYKLMLLLNRAQAYKWNGNQTECQKILDTIDWSATEPKFKLARAVLLENWDEACKLMEILSHDKDFVTCYPTWPIFKDFVKQPSFKEKYMEIYNEDFKDVEVSEEVILLGKLAKFGSDMMEKS